MGSIVDRAIIRTTLAAQPQLRFNLRALIQGVTAQAFSDTDLQTIEHELIDSISVSEALGMPSSTPSPGQPLALSASQWGTVRAVLARFRDHGVRSRLEAEIGAAVTAGRMRIL